VEAGSCPFFGWHRPIICQHVTLSRVKHRYRWAGRYTVALTVVDNRGNLKATAHAVTIRAR